MRMAGKSRKTIHNQRSDIRVWLDGIEEFRQITPRQIEGFVHRNGAGSTVRNRLATITGFLDFCVATGVTLSNPAREVRIGEVSKPKPVKPMTDEQVKILLANTTGFWNMAVALGRYAGFTIQDCCLLNLQSFAVPGKILCPVRRGDAVLFPLHPMIKRRIKKLPKPEGGEYFPDEAREARDQELRAKVSVYFKRIATRLGIEDRSFQSLRVAFARECKAKKIHAPHIKGKLAV